jgi:hypothetical protein
MFKYRVMIPPFILHIKSYASTTVLLLHIQGYAPYCSVIPHELIEDITLYVGNKLQLCMCKDNIKVGGITLYVEF